MKWTAYKLIYRAMSPVHIGHHDLGYIKLSRPYITGRAMWGAATANLTRTYGKCRGQISTEYARFGELFKDRIIFSYFFPALEEGEPWLPRYTEKGLYFESASCPAGSMSERRFQQIFFGSFLQTAVSPQVNTAEDETLHESEFIRHMVVFPATGVNGCARPVYFVGYVFIRNDAALDGNGAVSWEGGDVAIRPAVEEIFVGGDRKYGWGRLRLTGIHEKISCIHGCRLVSDESDPTVCVKSGQALPAHVYVDEKVALNGDIELYVGRLWQGVQSEGTQKNTGPGRCIRGNRLCWMPGSILKSSQQDSGLVAMSIGEFGILKKKNDEKACSDI